MLHPENLNLRGDIVVRLRHRDGRVRYVITRNTITYRGIDSPLYLWAPDGVTVSDYDFRNLDVGSNATPPTRGDTGLLASFLTIPINNPSQRVRSAGQVEVRASISSGTALGNTIREFGILLGNGQLFARQTTPDIPLTGVFGVDISWRITVTA